MIRWVYTFDAFFFEIVIDVWSYSRDSKSITVTSFHSGSVFSL